MSQGMTLNSVKVSSTGKVLLTGAYLVLEKPNAGLVLSTSARFYASATSLDDITLNNKKDHSCVPVRVVSPQLERITNYLLEISSLKLFKTSESDHGNPFIENAIELSVGFALLKVQGSEVYSKLISELVEAGLSLTLLGSNSFYSHRRQLLEDNLPLISSSLKKIPPFSPVTTNQSTNAKNVPEVAKTGLGSSAAMTTAAVGSILQFLGVINLEDGQESRDLVHKISQAAHCAGQGKIGSGFDVSTASFGSQRYVRFSPSVLNPAMEALSIGNILEASQRIVSADWDEIHEPWALPRGLILMLGEPGVGGSSTPSMVGAVQNWRKQFGESALKIWESLAQGNRDVENGLKLLSKFSVHSLQSYDRALEICSQSNSSNWLSLASEFPESSDVIKVLTQIKDSFNNVRFLLQQMGENAKVPIEPDVQTAILDLTANIPGVLFAGVPGAGGYDAIFAIVLSTPVKAAVEQVWAEKGVLTLDVEEDPFGLKLEP